MSFDSHVVSLWSRKSKNPDVSTGPLTRTFPRLPAPLTHSLALHRSLPSRAQLRSARGKLRDKMLGHQPVLNHCAYHEKEEDASDGRSTMAGQDRLLDREDARTSTDRHLHGHLRDVRISRNTDR